MVDFTSSFKPGNIQEPVVEDGGDGFTSTFKPEKPSLMAPIEDAIHVNPDDHAKNLRLSKESGLPTAAIEQDQRAVENLVKSKEIRDSLDKHEFTSTWIAEGDNARLAHDDVEGLTALEAITNAWDRGITRIKQAGHQWMAEESAEMYQDVNRSFGEIFLDQNASSNPVESLLAAPLAAERFITSRLSSDANLSAKRSLEAVAKRGKEIQALGKSDPATKSLDAVMKGSKEDGWRGALMAIASDPLGAAALSAEIGIEFAPQMIVGAVATATTTPAGGAATMGVLSGMTERYASPVEFLGSQGIDLNDPSSIDRVINDPELMAKAKEFGFTRGAIIGSFDALSGGLASKAFGGPLKTMAAQMGVQASMGGGGEAAAQLATTGKVDPGEVVLEALGEFAMAPFEVIGVGGQYVSDFKKSNRAKKDAKVIEAMNAHESNLRERSPEKYAEFQGKLLRENGIEQISISGEGFSEYNQSGGDTSWIETLGLSEKGKLEMYENMDGDIELTPEQYSLIPPEIAAQLSKHIRINDGMTEAEADVFNESGMQDEFERISETFQALDSDTQYDIELIQQKIEGQLQAAGESPETSSNYGVLMAQRYMTRAQRAGQNPLEMYMNDNLSITQGEQMKKVVDDLTVNLDIARSKKTKEDYFKLDKQPIAKQIINSVGGIDPDSTLAGELRSRDITPKMVPGLFKEGGITDGNNLVRSQFPFFSEQKKEEDQNDYVSTDELIAAIEREAFGEANHTQSEMEDLEGFDIRLENFNAELESLGLDVNENTDEEIRAAIEGRETRKLFQDIGDPTATPEFKEWFGDSKVVDESGKPLVVYHGTPANVDEDFAFDYTRIGDQGRAEGAGFYFTSDRRIAGGYGKDGEVISSYMSIENPMAFDQPAFDNDTINKIIMEIAKQESVEEDMGIGDGFLSNFGDVNYEGLESVVNSATDLIADEDLALDQIGGIIGSGASVKIVNDALTKITGHDGVITKGFSNEGVAGGDIYVAFSPTQVKSVHNIGAFDPKDPRILYQGGFQSNVEKFISDIKQEKGSGDQFLAQIKKAAGVKEEEISWIGLDEFLKGKKSVTKQEMLDFIEANSVEIEEVTLGDVLPEGFELREENGYFVTYSPEGNEVAFNSDRATAEKQLEAARRAYSKKTKYGDYTLPGGENYREVLLTLPSKDGVKISGYIIPEDEDATDSILHDVSSAGLEDLDYGRTTDRGDDEIIEFTDLTSSQHKEIRQIARDSGQVFIESKKEGVEETYSTTHFPDQENILAHVRLNDRTDADGNKVLFIEEIQSDWHQEGRKRGYKKDIKILQQKSKKAKAHFENWIKENPTESPSAWREQNPEMSNDVYEFSLQESNKIQQVPDAPLKKTWHEMALRRVIQMASEQGYDSIAWTTGEQQNDRFDLSKQVDEVNAARVESGIYSVDVYKNGNLVSQKNLSGSELEGFIGKDLAQKIIDNEDVQSGFVTSFSGQDLKVGGEGMKGFYDKIIPKYAKKFGKKFGAKVGTTKITGQAPGTDADAKLLDELGVKGTGSKTAEVWSMPITDEMRESAKQGISLFQQNRASIQFSPSGTTINLGLGADRSSFLHESGHLFLEQLRQDQQEFGTTNEQLVDDWNAVTKWWGKNAASLKQEAIDLASRANDADAVAEIASMSDKKVKDFVVTGNLDRGQDAQGYLSVAMHEQWARGVEDYFRTGQAPSIALQDAFNRFRAWMVSIYKKATGKGGLDIQFSPDVKEVMDRLLATDQEIELMASQYDMKAMFGSAQEIGMTKGQFENYQRDVARSVEEGKTKQLKKHLNDIERERKAWWIDERNSIKSEVEQEVHERKEYKLMYALANGTEPNGESLNTRPNRMDRKAIDLIMENDNSAKRLPKIGNKVLYATAKKEGSTHPDIVAMSYGYGNSRDMLIELMNVEPMDSVVNAEADIRMKEKYGDMQIPDQAESEAIESIHGDKRGEVLILELNALREGQEKMKSAFVRQWAKEQIGKHKVDNIKPTKFLAAEKRFAKLAAKEFKAGNMLEAQRAKFRQMMNHFMARESYKIRDEMNKSRNYMRKFNKKKALFKSIDADYIDRIKEILGSYQLGPRLSDKKRRQISSDAFVKWMDDQAENEGAIFNIPQEILDANEKTHYRDLTLDEFRTLTDSIKNLEAQGRLKKKALISGELIDIQQMESDIMDRLDNLPIKAVERAKAIRQDPSFKDKATERFHSFDASLRKVEFLLEFMDGEDIGPAHQAFFQPVAEAENMKNDIVRNINQVFMDKLEALPKDVRKNLGRAKMVPSLGREMNRGNLLMMALNVGNESNLDKMIRGSEQEGAMWTEDGIMEALEVLTKEEWDFIQSVWDAFDGIYPQVQDIYRRENGVSPEKIESKKIETKHGEYTGRYFPMMYDPRRSAMSRDLEGKSALEAMQSQTVKAGVFSGMTKARTNFAAPVLLDIAAVPSQVRRMAHYVSHYETVRLTRKLLSRKTLSTAITEKLGETYYRELKAWIGDVAADGQTDKVLNFWDRAVEAMRSNVTIAIMGLSYTTGMSQPLGWAQSIDALSKQDDGTYKPQKGSLALAWGMKQAITQKGITEHIMEVSGQMRHRIDNIDRDLSHAMKQLSGKKGIWKKFQRSTLLHIAYIQFYMVDIPTWIAAQDKALVEGRSESQAINYADSVVRKTQTAGGTKDLAQIQRQRGLMNAFTMFYSFFNLLYNIQARAIGATNFKKPRDVGRFAAKAAVILVLPTALEAMMRGEKPDEDDDYAKWLAIKSMLYSATSIAFVRDLTGIAEGFGYSTTPLDSIPKEMAKAMKEIAQAYDDGEMNREAAVKALSAAGYAFGFPVLQPKRLLDTLEKWDNDGTMPDMVEFLRGPDDD